MTDEEIIRAMADTIEDVFEAWEYGRERNLEAARAVLRIAAPEIRERAAKVAEGLPHNRDWVPGSLYDTLRREVAAAIRNSA